MRCGSSQGRLRARPTVTKASARRVPEYSPPLGSGARRQRVGELVLRHRRAPGDAGLLRALVELVAREAGEVVAGAVVAAAVPVGVAVARPAARAHTLERRLERGHDVRRCAAALVLRLGRADALSLLLSGGDLEQPPAGAGAGARRVPVDRPRVHEPARPAPPGPG